MMKKLLLFLSVGISHVTDCWMDFTNTLPEEINVTVYFENNTNKNFVLAQNAAHVRVFASNSNSSIDEHRVTQIVAWSDKKVIIDWDTSSSPHAIHNDELRGTPMYGYKDTGVLGLNKYLKPARYFKTSNPSLKKFNGMIHSCNRSSQGFDTSGQPLEIIIIEEENIFERTRILNSLPEYYYHIIPAGTEIGGQKVVVLAWKIK